MRAGPRSCRRWARRRLRLGLALLLGLTALGCAEERTPEPAQGVTRIVFKHGKVTQGPQAIGALIEAFEEANPDIDVVDEELPSSSDEQHQFYVINLQGGSADFDVLALDVIWIAEFARAGWVRPVDPLVGEHDRADFFRGTLEAVTWEGHVYAVPWFIGAGLLYYREDLLEEQGLAPPRTWPELQRAALAIRRARPDLHGYVWQGKQYEGLVCNALEVMWSRGGEVLKGGRSVVDSEENRAALAFLRGLVESGATPAFVTTLIEEPTRRVFQDGRAAFMRNWAYAWPLLQEEGSAVRGKVGVSVLPRFEGHAPAAALGGWHLGINRYSRHPEAAARFIRFMTSREAQRQLALMASYQPTRRSLYDDPELLAKQPFLTELEPVFESARPRPVTPYYMMISQILQLELSAALTGLKAPAAALSSADAQLERVLAIEEVR